MHERLQLHFRHMLMNVLDLRQRQLARQDDALDSELLPELHRRPVDGIGLHRQVYRNLRKLFQRETDHPRIGHDESIRFRLGEIRQRFLERFNFAVGWQDIGGDVNLLAQLTRLVDGVLQRRFLERILPRAQRKLRDARIHRIRAIRERIIHLFRTPRRSQ